jgi:hypothetical protein
VHHSRSLCGYLGPASRTKCTKSTGVGFLENNVLEFLGAPPLDAWTLSGFCQRNREERFDRIALIGALAAQIGVEIAPDFKLIELGLRH